MAYSKDAQFPNLVFFNILFVILICISTTHQAVNTDYANGTDAIEPGYLFAKFASKLSELNFRVSRRSNTVYTVNHRQCSPQLRGDVAQDIGVGARMNGRRGRGGRHARAPTGPRSQADGASVKVWPSGIFDNKQFRNILKRQCTVSKGFPNCYLDDLILHSFVVDYSFFAREWLPNCNVTRECAKLAERGRTETWFSSRWERISSNRSSSLPVCYEVDDMKELTPERKDSWWFDFCCFTGAICEPFSESGWGKLLAADSDSSYRVSQHLSILHNSTCPSERSETSGEFILDRCIIDVINAWNLLSGPTQTMILSDAVETLVRCDPYLWMNPVRTLETLLNKLTPGEIRMIHSVFDSHITPQRAATYQQVMKTHSSGSSPIMTPHEFEMTPRAVSGIVIVIILIFLSILVGAWAVYQKVQTWRHPRNHIAYAPIVMQDDFLDDGGGGNSQGEMERIRSWSRVEDLPPDSDPEINSHGDG